MKAYEFLDNVLKEVRYKPRHDEIRDELRSHIEELAEQNERFGKENAEDMAVRYMGDAEELGRKINKQYYMPFNSKYGISIWSCINTMLIYFLYPVWLYIWKRYPTMVTYAAIVPIIYVVLSIMYLKRGHFKFNLCDWRDILIGTLAGAAVSIGSLLLFSSFFKFGYYPYGAMCKIPIKWNPVNYDMPMVLFSFWVCWMIYMISLAKPKKTKGGQVFMFGNKSVLYPVPINIGDSVNDYWNDFDVFNDSNKE